MIHFDITKIYETDELREANEYLDLGWKLLYIYETTYETDDPNIHDQIAHYILGWPKGTTEPVYPQPDPDNPITKILNSYNSN